MNRTLDFPFSKPPEMAVERYLLTLLAAVVKNAGGEVKIPIKDIVDAEEGDSIIKSPSSDLTSLVLRCAPRGTDLLRSAWETPTPKTRIIPMAENQHRSQTLDDVRLALMEEERVTRQQEDSPRTRVTRMPSA